MKPRMNSTILINILSTILLQGISFISAPIISRMLGTENYGITSVYLTWVSFAIIVLGGQTFSTLNIARIEYPEEVQEEYQSSALGLSCTFFFIGIVFTILFLEKISNLLQLHKLIIIFLMIHAYGQYCTNFLNTKFTYELKAERNLYLSVAVSLLVFLLSLLMVSLWEPRDNYWGRILAMTLVYAFFGISISFYIFSKGKRFYDRKYWKFALSLSLPMIVHGLAGTLLGQCDRIMLQQMGNNSVVGIYSLAAAFGGIMVIIWNALNNSWCPHLFEFLRTKSNEQIVVHGRNYLELYTVLTIGFMLLAPEVYRIFAGKEFWSGTQLIPIFAVNAYFGFLYAFPVNHEFYHKKTSAIATGTLLAGLCNIVLNYFLIHWGNEMGAAMATMISNLLLFLFHHCFVIWFCKDDDYPFSLQMLMPYTLIVILAATGIFCTEGFWLIRWLIGAVIGVWEILRMIKRKAIF